MFQYTWRVTPLPSAALLDVIKRVRGIAQKNAAIAGARVALFGNTTTRYSAFVCDLHLVAPQQLTRLPPAAVARLAKEPTNGVIMQARIVPGLFSTKSLTFMQALHGVEIIGSYLHK